jgi:hypothetical protein
MCNRLCTPRRRIFVTPEHLLSEKPFPRAVPLRDIIDCLVEIWQEDDD